MLHSIHALRFLAALGVVVHHSELFGRFNITVGAAGVDLFFVISGVVIGTSGPGMAVSDFLWRRFIRIFPLYWVAAAAVLAFREYYSQPTDLPQIIHSVLLIPPDLSNTWNPLYFPSWTLTFEIFFYAVFAVCLAITPRWPRLVGSVVLMLFAFSLWDPHSPNFCRFAAMVMLEFVAGLLISVAIERKMVPGRLPGLILIAAAIGGFAYSARLGISQPREIYWGIPAVVMVYGALAFEHARILRHPFIVLGGNASYAIYLFHLLFIWIFEGNFGGPLVAAANRPLFAPIEIIGSVIVGMAIYKLLDKPMLHYMRVRLAPASA